LQTGAGLISGISMNSPVVAIWIALAIVCAAQGK
jgi:hypothetical protein